ncbi:unnamed protein product [Sympodiomycopsis kandeliae]
MSQDMNLKADSYFEVVIAGAGPAGLTLATSLLNHGVPPTSILLLDRRSDFTPESESRASLLNARSMESIEKYLDDPSFKVEVDEDGERTLPTPMAYNAPFNANETKSLTEEFLKRAHLTRTAGYYDRNFANGTNPLFKAELSTIKGTKYRFGTSIAQGFIERGIAARLNTLGGKIFRNHKVVAIDYDSVDHERSVKVRIQNLQKKEETIDIFAGLIVGADGGNSVVRSEAGIIAEGFSFDGEFLVADLKVKDPKWPFVCEHLGTNDFGIMPTLSEHGLATFIPMPGQIFRMVGSSMAFKNSDMVIENYDEDKSAAVPGRKTKIPIEMMQKILDSRGPDMSKYRPDGKDDIERPNEITNVLWASVYKIYSRIANTMFRKDKRTAIIGDAAHQHSPAGGQGLNSGIIDALSLANALIKHLAPESPSLQRPEGWVHAAEDLQSWADKRRPEVIKIATFANTLQRVGAIRGVWPNYFRNLALRWFGPWLAPKMAYGLMGLRQTV